MRALTLLVAIACSSARPAPVRPLPACDELSLVGRAEPVDVASHPSGAVAMAGNFEGQLRAGNASSSSSSPGMFVLRTNVAGEVRWLRTVANGAASAVAIAADGDVVVAGSVASQCYLARLAAADGAQRWAFRIDGDGESACRALSIDAAGDVWTVGRFSGAIPGARSNGMSDLFVLKLSGARGEATLVRAAGGKGKELPRAILALASGDVVVGGQFGGEVEVGEAAVDFGKGPVQSAGGYDGFVLELDAAGRTKWVATFGDNGDDEVNALAAGPDGAIFASGHLQPAGDYRQINAHDVPNMHGVVLRYSSEGRGEWVRVFEGSGSYANDLAVDEKGRLWTAGASSGLRTGNVDIPAAGSLDAFALALNPADGEPLGFRSFASRDFEVARGLARIPGGLVLGGFTRGELQICDKLVGAPGEQTAFLVWLRDL